MAVEVLGIGNALVDVLSQEHDDLLAALALPKGSMTLIDYERAAEIYEAIGPAIETSGGSAANTMVGIAQEGHRTGFIGRVHDDELGRVFAHDLHACGVEFRGVPTTDGEPTGRCFVLVTPDGERTMATSLGASRFIDPSDIAPEHLADINMLYLEGYLWDLEEAKASFRHAATLARSNGKLVAFTLSDSFCVERHCDEFEAFIESSVNLVFANEEEALALSAASTFEAACDSLSKLAPHVVITRGAMGSCVLLDGESHTFPAVPVPQLVDTTGAGDLFAAGYISGMMSNGSIEQCAHRGAAAASAILGQLGARRIDLPRTIQ